MIFAETLTVGTAVTSMFGPVGVHYLVAELPVTYRIDMPNGGTRWATSDMVRLRDTTTGTTFNRNVEYLSLVPTA